MSGPSKVREFPDITNKLSAPSKKPLFERQKAEAEEKRRRDEAETAAVYRDFVKSFDDEDEDEDNFPRARNTDGGGRGYGPGTKSAFGGASRRHFAPSNLKSGPGSLGPAPPSLARKRALDAAQPRQSHSKGHSRFDYEDGRGVADVKSAFQQSVDEEEDAVPAEERAAPKPTLHLSLLVPGTSPAAIKTLIPKNLQVDSVRLLPPPPSGSTTEKRSASAIVTLAQDTPASDIDAAVSALQNKYLGFGYKLNISRHLSSAVIGGPAAGLLSSSAVSQPFAAAPAQVAPVPGIGRGQPSHRGGYAPPSSYAPQSQGRGSNSTNGPMTVVVKPPTDIKELKLIHKTLEALLTHGPEFEALLMSRPDVQKDEKWIWLWDARSPGGIWYRWRLWEMLSGKRAKPSGNQRQTYSLLFDTGAPWQSPEHNLKFEFTTNFDSFVSDPDYDSSEEEDDADDADKQQPGRDALTGGSNAEFLNPLHKAKLIHLLSRLPSTTSRLRKGDVARVTAFAISHAGRGSEEVVKLLLDNVDRPFIFSSANPSRKVTQDEAPQRPSSPNATASDNEDHEADQQQHHQSSTTTTLPEKDDVSSATLIGLYLISDLLSSSSTSGVRHAWRYRQLFETALQSRKTFTRLGNMERELAWGRLRAEKWRRAVMQLLSMWEGWCVFGSGAQEALVKAFEEACEGEKKAGEKDGAASASTAVAGGEVAGKDGGKSGVGEVQAKKKGWKSVDAAAAAAAAAISAEAEMQDDLDGEPMDDDEDVDGEPMAEDDDEDEEDMDGQPMEEDGDEDVNDGEPMEEDHIGDGPPPATSAVETSRDHDVMASSANAQQHGTGSTSGKRKRPTAADMFAESDEE